MSPEPLGDYRAVTHQPRSSSESGQGSFFVADQRSSSEHDTGDELRKHQKTRSDLEQFLGIGVYAPDSRSIKQLVNQRLCPRIPN